MKKKVGCIKWILSIILLVSLYCIPAHAATGFDVEEVYESVFVIYTDSSVGSGFAIGENGIITNAHVVENAKYVSIVTYDGLTYDAQVVLYDDHLDLALLVASCENMKPLKVGSINNLKVGDDIYTIGAPNSMAYTLTKGVISAKERVVKRQSYIQIDAAINGGNSGGPLLNDYGEVIGVNTLKMSDAEGIGLAIPIERVLSFLTDDGIEVDSNSNIENKLDYFEPEVSTDDNENVDTNMHMGSELKKLKKKNSILVIILFFSTMINLVFLSIYLLDKRKRKDIVTDPSERTDFEIDIEE